MSIKTLALGAIAAAAFAVPAQAQIWKRGDVVVRQDERVISRSDQRTVYGEQCVDVQVDRMGSRRTERVCDYDRDGVYGDSDDRRIAEQRRRDSRRYEYDNGVYRNRGQARKAEVHARNEARKREREREKREREALKEHQKREREELKRRQRGGNPRW